MRPKVPMGQRSITLLRPQLEELAEPHPHSKPYNPPNASGRRKPRHRQPQDAPEVPRDIPSTTDLEDQEALGDEDQAGPDDQHYVDAEKER